MSALLRTSIVAAVVVATAAACAPRVGRHGYQPIEVLPSEIAVGTDTRETVLARLGSPSAVSTFEPNIWFYISQTTERYTFNQANIAAREVTAITFDETSGAVAAVDVLTQEDSQRIAYNERETPTRGRALSALEQILGTVGRQRLPGTDDDDPRGRRPGE